MPTRSKSLLTPLAAALVLAAFWPVLGWWWRRVWDDSDEPLGVLALIGALAFVWRDRGRLAPAAGALAVAALCMILTRALAADLPMLVAGLGLVLVLVLALRLWALPGVVMLLSLALPWVATLQFFAGYPLRLIVAAVAEKTLRLFGFEVTREGTDLWHNGLAIGVDAPCSGIRMLWFLLFAGAFLAARFRLRWMPCLLLMSVAGMMALLANAVRATVLFFPEAGLVHWSHWTHEATGLLLFAPCLLALMVLARRWESRGRQTAPANASYESSRPLAAFAALSLVVAVSWAWRGESSDDHSPQEHTVSWPDTFRGLPLEPLPLSVREEHFAAGFPGALARFRCGEGEVILRRVSRATRKLHSAQDCFQAAGFTLQRLSAAPLESDGLWQVWRATRGSDPPLIVCEHIRSAGGDLILDVSAWYWRALRHPEEGPWTAITWVRREDEISASLLKSK